MNSMLDTSAPPSQKAAEAMERFDASCLAVLRRTRVEGLIALSASVALTLAALPFFKPAGQNAVVTNDTAATLMSMLLSTALVLAWVSVIRIFQSALYPTKDKTWAPFIDHFAIMWATGYAVWLLYGLGAAWQ